MPCTIRHVSVAARMEIHLMHGSRRAEMPWVPALQGQSRPRAQMLLLLLNPTDKVPLHHHRACSFPLQPAQAAWSTPNTLHMHQGLHPYRLLPVN